MQMVILHAVLTAINIVLIGLLLASCYLNRHEKNFTFWFGLALCAVMALDVLAIWL